jgi:hypothetical protein
MNVHGAGAQRSDPKSGDPANWPYGHGPQGDEVRIYNYVRCVRGGLPGIELWGNVTDQTLELAWTGFPGASEHWVYGAENETYFEPGLAPGYSHRLVSLPGSTTTWSSAAGVGDPSGNWTYLVLAANAQEQELCRSNRFGEQDFGTAVRGTQHQQLRD